MASLPYPRRPPNSFHRTHSKFVCTEFTEFTEVSGGEYPPTDFTEYTEASGVEEPPTDAHRWLGCVGFSHGIHRIHRSFWRRRASHGFHRCTQMVRLRRVLPRNSQNTQKFLAEKILPQMRTDGLDAHGSPTEHAEPTEVSGVEGPPTDAHRCTQIFLLRQKILCVNSVGR